MTPKSQNKQFSKRQGFDFFHGCFSKIMLSILFTWRKVKSHVIFDRKTIITKLRIIKETDVPC